MMILIFVLYDQYYKSTTILIYVLIDYERAKKTKPLNLLKRIGIKVNILKEQTCFVYHFLCDNLFFKVDILMQIYFLTLLVICSSKISKFLQR